MGADRFLFLMKAGNSPISRGGMRNGKSMRPARQQAKGIYIKKRIGALVKYVAKRFFMRLIVIASGICTAKWAG